MYYLPALLAYLLTRRAGRGTLYALGLWSGVGSVSALLDRRRVRSSAVRILLYQIICNCQ
nr:MAG TPA: hypothetical protein [Bacteriophage sp.]